MSNAIRDLSRTGRLFGAAALVVALSGCVGAPEVVQPTGYGATCYAGAYTCQLGAQHPMGSQCSCPGLGAPSFGAVR